MASTGFKLPQSSQELDYNGGQQWSNISNIETDAQATYAEADCAKNEESYYLIGSNYDFASIPDGATIDGIEVQIEHYGEATNLQDVVVRLFQGTTPVGDDNGRDSAVGTSWVTHTYGSDTDTWTASLDAADIKNSNFGVGVVYSNVVTQNFIRWIRTNTLRIQVHYSVAGIVQGQIELGDGVNNPLIEATLDADGTMVFEASSALTSSATLAVIGSLNPKASLTTTSTLTCTGKSWGAGLQTDTYHMASGSDDGTEISNGSVTLDDSPLSLASSGYMGSRITIGLPSYANIEKAEFFIKVPSLPSYVDFTAYVEDSDDAPILIESTDNISNRTMLAGSMTAGGNIAYVGWISLGECTEEIVDILGRVGWEYNDHVLLRTTVSAACDIYAYESGIENSAYLEITYTTDGSLFAKASLSSSSEMRVELPAKINIVATSTIQATEESSPTKGMLAHYPLQSNANNLVNPLLNGINTGGVEHNGVYTTYKAADYTTIPLSEFLGINGAFTFTAFVRTTINAVTYRYIFDTNDFNLYAYTTAPHGFRASIRNLSNSLEYLDAGNYTDDPEWQFITISWDGTTGADNFKSFVDNILEGTSSQTTVSSLHGGEYTSTIGLSFSNDDPLDVANIRLFEGVISDDARGYFFLKDSIPYVSIETTSILTCIGTVVEEGGDVTHYGAADLDADATLASLGRRLLAGATAVAVSATLAVAGGVYKTGALDIDATSTLTVLAERDRASALDIDASSTLDILGLRDRHSALDISSSATLDALSEADKNALADLTAASTLTVLGERDRESALDISASSTLTVLGERNRYSALDIDTTSTLDVEGQRNRFSAFDVSTTATLDVLGERDRASAIDISSSTTLTAVGIADNFASADLDATSTLDVDAQMILKTGTAWYSPTTLAIEASVLRFAHCNLGRVILVDGNGVPLTYDGEELYSPIMYTFLKAKAFSASLSSVYLTATSTLTVAGQGVYSGASDLDATSTLTINGRADNHASVDISASSTLEVIGLADNFASADLSTTSTLEVTSSKDANALADLSTTSTLDVEGQRDRASALDISSSVTLEANGLITVNGASELFATSTLTVIGIADNFASADLDTTSALAILGECDREALSTLTASSILAVTSEAERHAQADLSSTATLSAIPSTDGVLTGRADLFATSTLSVIGTGEKEASITLSCDTTLDVIGIADNHAAIALDAVSTLDVDVFATREAKAELVATSTLIVTSFSDGTKNGQADLTSTSQVVIVGSADNNSAIDISASSTLEVISTIDKNAYADLSTTSTLDADAFATRNALIELTTTSTLTVISEAEGELSGRADLTSTATLEASSEAFKLAQADISTTSVLSIDGTVEGLVEGAVELFATSTLTALADPSEYASASLSATSVITISTLAERLASVSLIASSELLITGGTDAYNRAELFATSHLLVDVGYPQLYFGSKGVIIRRNYGAIISDINPRGYIDDIKNKYIDWT